MQLGIPKLEAEKYISMYFKAYPLMATYIERQNNWALWNLKIVTPFGQRRNQYAAQPVFKNTAAYNACLRNSSNVGIQSPTSTLGLITFAELNRSGMKPLGAKAICTVYDSSEWEIPIPQAAEALEAGFFYMDDWPVKKFGDWLELPIGVEAEVGTTWGNAEVVHRGTTQVEIETLVARLKSTPN